ncbi:MAG: hypothetical protein R6X17_04225 [Candidatus Competibacteraceae bacterium]
MTPEPESKPAVETAADDPPEALGRPPRPLPLGAAAGAYLRSVPIALPDLRRREANYRLHYQAVDVRAILAHLGEPATPPRIASARGPPAGDDFGVPITLQWSGGA